MSEYVIDYKCPTCGFEWQETWDCACDSDCQQCGCSNIQADYFRLLDPDLKSIKDVAEIQDLQLIVVVGDGRMTIISRKHRVILADGKNLDYDDSAIPTITLNEEVEQAIGKEVLNAEYDGSFPGWGAVFAYLDKHP